MKTRLKTQFLALLIVLSLGGLTSLEPVLHNHDLDIHEEHEDCFSCGWTKISIDETTSQVVTIQSTYKESNYQAPASNPTQSLGSSSLSRAPPFIS
ncbi:MAG: hypothetical protein HOK41_02825 [Nitrospina sp.]|jgi:hypothetical protein|nr:hypothetical protein [Nitrospina sp.]MBT6716231.1 hypothetical protein [Nitrospina sp.]